jgi:hypothetical protein
MIEIRNLVLILMIASLVSSISVVSLQLGNSNLSGQISGSITGIGKIRCSVDSKLLSTVIFISYNNWEVRTVPVPTDQVINGSFTTASMAPDHHFVLKGVETFDNICDKPIEPSNPPIIEVTGVCLDPLTRSVQLSGSNDFNGTFPALESCTGWFEE